MIEHEDECNDVQCVFRQTHLTWDAFQAFLELMPDAIVAVDVKGLVRTLNTQAEADFGYEREELIDQPVEILLPFALAHQHRAQREHFMTRPHTRPMRMGRNLRVRRKDCSELPVDIHLGLIEIAAEKLVIAVIHDVTERRRAEECIRQMNKELEIRVAQRITALETANRQLEAYGYTVSHELRSPLRVIRGFEQLLHEELDDAGNQRAITYLERMSEETQRMVQIIDGLLALARLDHAPLQRMPVDMTALVNSVVDELRAEQPKNDFAVAVGSLPAAHADAPLIRQVFANLLSNALKYSRKNNSVSVAINGYCRDGNVIYQVQDNGPGFDVQHAERIFEPFQRVGNTAGVDGLGIGLTLARRIVERHDGRIWAEGNASGGAAFFISLPA